MDVVQTLVRHVHEQLSRVVVGQSGLKTESVAVLLCEGHALIQGVPGIAKTLTVKTLARLVNLEFQRVQGTSDLMPADIVGTNVVAMATGAFHLHKGPAFTDLLLVDEVNRMPPRTQAALLECMEERQITIDGTRHELSAWFTVFATQNPVDFEGTYPLPEAQLDRFLARIDVGYPSESEEELLLAQTARGFDSRDLASLDLLPLPAGALAEARAAVKAVTVQEALLGYVVKIIRRTREWPTLALGASPRAAINVLRFARALAAIDDRAFVIPDDVKAAILPVLRHRVVVRPEAELEGVTADLALQELMRAVEVPR